MVSHPALEPESEQLSYQIPSIMFGQGQRSVSRRLELLQIQS